MIFPFQNICHVLYCGDGGGGGGGDVDDDDGGGSGGGGGGGGGDDDDDDDVRGSRNIHNKKVYYWFLRLHFFMYRCLFRSLDFVRHKILADIMKATYWVQQVGLISFNNIFSFTFGLNCSTAACCSCFSSFSLSQFCDRVIIYSVTSAFLLIFLLSNLFHFLVIILKFRFVSIVKIIFF